MDNLKQRSEAEAEAAAKVRMLEDLGDTDRAETWRRIRAAINDLRGSQIS